MKLSILHLSDLHIDSSKHARFKDFNQKIASYLSLKFSGSSMLFIVVSGDITLSGSKSQFDLAKRILKDLDLNIRNVCQNISVNFIFSPGNHDLEHLKPVQRELVVEKIIKNETSKLSLKSELLESCLEPFGNYFEFVQNFSDKSSYSTQEKLLTTLTFENEKVNFVTINSSFLSQIHETPGSMYFPIHLFEKELLGLDSEYTNICVMHHPFNWFSPKLTKGGSREIAKIISSKFDIIFFGHEHEPLSEQVTNISNEISSLRLNGGTINLHDYRSSCFSYIHIDERKINVDDYEYIHNRISHLKASEADLLEIKNKRTDLKISDSFIGILRDTEIGLTHKNKERVFLDEIYIWPEFEITGIEKKNLLEFESALDLINKDSFEYLVVGAEQSGKTSFCKKAFSELYSKGTYAIYAKGRDSYKGNFEKYLNEELGNSYQTLNGKLSDEYWNKDFQKRAIIIDNFEKFEFKDDSDREEFIQNVLKTFNKVIITVSDTYNIGEFFKKTDLLKTLTQVKLRPFGYELRGALISKWVALGGGGKIENHEESLKLQNQIDSIVGKNIVPSYPVYVLTILQAFDLNKPHDLKHTSYGYCYYSLIYFYLKKIQIKESDVGTYFNILSSLSFYLFENKKKHISFPDFKIFYEKYQKIYYCDISVEGVYATLIKSLILQKDSIGNVSFKYSYIYFYFVGRYLADHQSETEQEISSLFKNLHLTDNANIIVFLLHHTNDQKIIDELTLNSLLLFDSTKPATLSKDETDFMNSLFTNIAEFAIEHKNPEDYQKEKLKEKDKISTIEDKKNKVEENPEANISDFNRVFKTIEIFGQILKNRHGTLRQDNLKQLCSESYNVALRMLTYLLEFLSNKETEEILFKIFSAYRKNKEPIETESKIDLEADIRKFISSLCYYLAYAIVNKVSDAVGSSNLSTLYEEVSQQINSPASKLITFIIGTKYSNKIDPEKIKKLLEEYKNNQFVIYLIRKSVVEFIYMHHIEYTDKQKIAQILGIPVQRQRIIEGKNKK